MDKVDEIKWLIKELEDADFLYYNFGNSDYTDEEYDALEERLFKLDPNNKRFKDGKRNVVGSATPKTKKNKDHWKKSSHEYKMGSQAKVTTFDDLKKWSETLNNNPRYVVQDKLDGISISLKYENGELKTAVTRGTGKEGEDITRNVKKMEGVPNTIEYKKTLFVRGEILLFKSNFDHFDDGKTLRNTAAGTAKRLDGTGCDWLNIKVYDVQNWKDLGFKKVSSSIEFLKERGFDVVNSKVVKTLDEVQEIYEDYIGYIRDNLDWDIDGLVIKAGLFSDDDWATPKRSIAYKFPPKTAITKLENVIWQDSGGRISPVAMLESVEIDGVTISKATLNNIEYIKKLNIKIGDTVEISRRNDVIPCIEKVVKSDPNGKDIIPPTHDEEGYPIVREKNSNGDELVYLVSTNPNSKSKRIRRTLKWFVAHEAKGIANATIESIFNANIADDLPSFYDVCMNGHPKLVELDGFGAGMFKIMKKAALKTSQTDLIKFLTGMNLNGIGGKMIESICLAYNKEISLEDFIDLAQDISWLSTIQGVNENTAKNLRNQLKEKENLINDMKERVEVENWKPTQAKSTKINGLSFCFTGKMEHGRKELEKTVRENGGLVVGVSKKLDYLVTNDPNSGSSKNKKVDDLNSKGSKIQKISEKDYINMVGGID